MAAKKKVLLVDDDGAFVEVNKTLLEKKGYEVLTAFNGRECMEKLNVSKPDVIVLDVMMTRMGEGFDVSRDLRNSEQFKGIPIIMLTGVNQTVPFKFEPDPVWLPVDTFLEKPVKPERLLEEVKKALAAVKG